MLGVIIIAHGSVESSALKFMSQITEMVSAQLKDAVVEYGFICQKGSDFEEIAQRLDRAGVSEIVIAPYFLFDGGHVKKTIPRIAEAIARKCPDKTVTIKEPLGVDERLAQIVAERIIK